MKNINEKDFESQNNVLETITAVLLIVGMLFALAILICSYVFKGVTLEDL